MTDPKKEAWAGGGKGKTFTEDDFKKRVVEFQEQLIASYPRINISFGMTGGTIHSARPELNVTISGGDYDELREIQEKLTLVVHEAFRKFQWKKGKIHEDGNQSQSD